MQIHVPLVLENGGQGPKSEAWQPHEVIGSVHRQDQVGHGDALADKQMNDPDAGTLSTAESIRMAWKAKSFLCAFKASIALAAEVQEPGQAPNPAPGRKCSSASGQVLDDEQMGVAES